ncbi:MAG: class I SAM-dependent methyltransferase [Myxococcaceae bacterium]
MPRAQFLSSIAPLPTVRGTSSRNGGSVLGVAWQAPRIREALRKELFRLMALVPEARQVFAARLEKLLRTGASDTDVVHELRSITEPVRSEIQRGREIIGNVTADRVSETVLKLIPFPPNRVLDVGAGAGGVTSRIAQGLRRENLDTKLQVNAIDVAPEYQHLRGEGFRRVPMSTHSDRLPFDSNSHDVACLLMVLHHARDPVRLLSEVSRVLHPGGVLVVREHDARTLEQRTYSAALDLLSYRVLWPTEGVPLAAHQPLSHWISFAERQGFRCTKIVKDHGHELVNPHFVQFRKVR